MFTKKTLAVLAAAAVLGALLPSPAGAQTSSGQTTDHVTVNSKADGTQIRISIHKPSGATEESQVPVLLHSHGWGGSRSQAASSFAPFLNARMAVVSIDQRGHGQSGGQANVQSPDLETEDIKSVIDHIATLPWVLKDTDGEGNPIADDPVLGAMGGSYGGGYQTMTALDEIADEGRTRFNALAPEITWFNLNESLAPQGVVRTGWTALLYAAGARMLPQYVHEAFAYGAATGQWPDGTVLGQPAPGVPDIESEFYRHGPVYFADQGIQIDVPVLLRQGASDNLFNLNQGLHIFHKALTKEARKDSYFVSYNGGHALPNALPLGTAGGSDACSGDWTNLTVNFYKRAFAGESTEGLLPKRYNFTNVNGNGCILADGIAYEAEGNVQLVAGKVATPTGAGAPIHLPLAQGPITVTGIPKLSGTVSSAVVDSRAFFALSMGANPATAQVIQNNMMPLRRALPTVAEDFEIELPGVGVNVPAGQTLYLTISPVSDMSAGHGSRVPGALVLEDLTVALPGPGAAEDFSDPQDPDEEDPVDPDARCGPPEGQGKGKGSENCGPKEKENNGKDEKRCGPPEGQGKGKGSENCGSGDDEDEEDGSQGEWFSPSPEALRNLR